MRSIIKKSLFALFILWVIAATLWIVVLTQRQKDFEAFASAHIQLLMDELSITNINASRLESDIEKFKEERAKAVEQQPGPQSFVNRKCGPAKQEGEQ